MVYANYYKLLLMGYLKIAFLVQIINYFYFGNKI